MRESRKPPSFLKKSPGEYRSLGFFVIQNTNEL